MIINDLKGNGAERVAITLSESFARLGHEATIICFKNHIELPIHSSVKLLTFKISRWRWLPRPIRV